jgi:hypothetical protein
MHRRSSSGWRNKQLVLTPRSEQTIGFEQHPIGFEKQPTGFPGTSNWFKACSGDIRSTIKMIDQTIAVACDSLPESVTVRIRK